MELGHELAYVEIVSKPAFCHRLLHIGVESGRSSLAVARRESRASLRGGPPVPLRPKSTGSRPAGHRSRASPSNAGIVLSGDLRLRYSSRAGTRICCACSSPAVSSTARCSASFEPKWPNSPLFDIPVTSAKRPMLMPSRPWTPATAIAWLNIVARVCAPLFIVLIGRTVVRLYHGEFT